MNFYKLIIVALLACMAVVYTNCGSPFSSQSQLIFKSNVYGGADEISYNAFEETVYPLTRGYCASCHTTQAPKHASDDVTVAHDEVMSTQKVNFANIPNSRLVKKLRDENHNCWSDCLANADEMEQAISAWNDIIKDSAVVPTPVVPVVSMPKTASSRTIAEELASMSNPLKSNTVAINVSAAMVNAPMIKGADGYGDYLSVPDDGANLTLTNTDASAGIARMNFRIPAAGTYRIWGLVHAPDANTNAFYAGISTLGSGTMIGGTRTWDIPAGPNPVWRVLNSNFAITSSGDYTLHLRERKDGTKIYRIFVTADSSFNGEDVASFLGVTLSFDISSLVNSPNVRFLVDVSDYDMYSYLFTNPRIVTPSANIWVKNVRLLLNNLYNPQNSTFTIVNKVTTPVDGQLSTYAMIVLKENGAASDKVAFEFEELSVTTANGASGGAGGGTTADSLEAFTNSVYTISRANCASCHTTVSPRHASADNLVAHDAVLYGKYADFTTPSSSRIVQKVRSGHNCGSATNCSNIANAYEAAIIEWRTGRMTTP